MSGHIKPNGEYYEVCPLVHKPHSVFLGSMPSCPHCTGWKPGAERRYESSELGESAASARSSSAPSEKRRPTASREPSGQQLLNNVPLEAEGKRRQAFDFKPSNGPHAGDVAHAHRGTRDDPVSLLDSPSSGVELVDKLDVNVKVSYWKQQLVIDGNDVKEHGRPEIIARRFECFKPVELNGRKLVKFFLDRCEDLRVNKALTESSFYNNLLSYEFAEDNEPMEVEPAAIDRFSGRQHDRLLALKRLQKHQKGSVEQRQVDIVLQFRVKALYEDSSVYIKAEPRAADQKQKRSSPTKAQGSLSSSEDSVELPQTPTVPLRVKQEVKQESLELVEAACDDLERSDNASSSDEPLSVRFKAVHASNSTRSGLKRKPSNATIMPDDEIIVEGVERPYSKAGAKAKSKSAVSTRRSERR